MIPNLTSIIIILVATPVLLLITFLPAFIELKNPKDDGPRVISVKTENSVHLAQFMSLANIEDEQTFNGSMKQKLASIIAVLPSLEA
jgi:hypothetical protein